jgi:hypothetical protein
MANGVEPAPRGDGQGGIYAVLIIIVILIVGAILYFAGVFGGRGAADGDRDIDVRIETPDIGGGGNGGGGGGGGGTGGTGGTGGN